jgi:exonuclease SbcC
MLGIDALDDVIKEIRSDKKTKDDLIEKINSDLVDQHGKNKDEIYRQEIKDFEKKKQEINTVIKKSKEKNQQLTKQLKTLEKDFNKNKNEYEKLNEQREKLAEKKTLFEQKKKLQEEIKELKNKIGEREKTISQEKKKLEAYKTVENDVKKTEKRLDEINKTLEKLVKTIEQKKTLSKRVKEDILDIDSKKKNIEKLGPDASCPTCERVLADQYNILLKKFDKEQTSKEKEIERYGKQVKTEEEEKDRFSREQMALQKKKNYLDEQLRKKERIDTIIHQITSEIKREKSEINSREQTLKRIGVITFDPKQFESVKKQVDLVYKKYQSSLQKFNDQKDILSDLNLSLEKREGERRLVDQEIKNLQDKISELDKFKKQLKEEKNSVRYLGMLSDVMGDFRTFLISRIRPTLSSYSSDFFSRLTDGKYAEVELDENYDLFIYDNGEKYSIERFSGGEEDLANLCLRLAISEVITERAGGVFNFIILDEIFGSQDVIRRHNIMKALGGLSGKFRQIFLITHVEDVKNDMENIIFVTEKEDGISSVKIE